MTVDWSISGGVPPRFWLGDRVMLKTIEHRIGTVHGLEWRSSDEFYGRCGWWCRVRWDGGSALMGLHEDSLEALG